MKLYTNKISTGKSQRFEDFVKKYQEDKQIKTASVKVAEEKDEADSSGQLDVEPLHQEGESTTMPKNGPSAKKESDESVSTEKVAEEKDEADSSGQPEAEGKLVNDPKVPSKEEKGGSADKAVKVAGHCAKCDESEEDYKCDCKDCSAAKEVEVKTAGIKGNCSKCGKPNFLCKGKCSGDDSDSSDDKDDDKEEKDDDKEEKEAKTVEFVKIANLDDKNKGFLKEYWRQLFGDDYVNALIADK